MDLDIKVEDIIRPEFISGVTPNEIMSVARSANPSWLRDKLKYMKYPLFLKTPYWWAVSKIMKERSNNRCQLCNSGKNLQVHHRSYEHRGEDHAHLGNLICLCKDCHSKFHWENASNSHSPECHVVPPKKGAPFYLEVDKDGLVLITAENCRRLKMNKHSYHWMIDTKINPRKSKWSERAIGYKVPKEWMRGS